MDSPLERPCPVLVSGCHRRRRPPLSVHRVPGGRPRGGQAGARNQLAGAADCKRAQVINGWRSSRVATSRRWRTRSLTWWRWRTARRECPSCSPSSECRGEGRRWRHLNV
ncbi:hypothetical protein OYC64_015290 [Pagothenia borchgrevinki]|uniref:Uncharacterized protein n=1 Tax=Pagothenia borchgrevinki TaxID=8213 RepID=A0ABD2HGZ1_PAGBO